MPQLNRKLAFRILGLLVSLACLGYFSVSAIAAFKDANTHLELQTALLAVLTALPPYALGYLTFAWVWHLLLTSVGVHARFGDTAGIFLTSQFGKYLPGNVAHHAGRIYLARRIGYATAPVAASMALEIVLIVGAALLLSLPLVSLLTAGLPSVSGGLLLAVGALVLLTAVLAIAAAMRHERFVASWFRFFSKLSLPPLSAMAGTLSLSVVLAIAAIGLSAVSLAMLGSTDWARLPAELPFVIALFSVAWIAGLLTPGAPAGVGIRELILMKGLTESFGATGAVTAAILFRLLTIAADVIALGVGTVLLSSSRIRSVPNPQ